MCMVVIFMQHANDESAIFGIKCDVPCVRPLDRPVLNLFICLQSSTFIFLAFFPLKKDINSAAIKCV